MTTSCLQTNTLPDTWSTLLTTSTCKYVDDDFISMNFIDSTWFTDNILPDSASPEDTLSQREEPSFISSASQREGSSSTSPPGWNGSHGHNTRFRKKISATTASTSDMASSLHDDLYSAFISVQDSYPNHSTSDLPFLEHYSCAASTYPDVMDYGAMLKDPDRSAFEQDMIHEVNDLLHTNTVKLSTRSSVPTTTKDLPSIWSFR
jgi:hypothetical protein